MKISKSAAILAAAVLILAASFIVNVSAEDSGAGSASDPVVTKSYVDSMLKELKEEINTGVKDSDVFTAYEFSEGSVVTGNAGTEMILRSGEAVCVDSTGNGIPDCTKGIDVQGGKTIEKNHLLIIPRSDGRGIQMNTSGFIMIKGGFSVK